MELLIIGAAIGAGFSGILLIARQIYLNWREKKKDKAKLLIKPLNSNRRIDSSIFEFLTPGNSIEAMRASLGVPNKKKQEEGAVHESTVTAGKTNSYLYLFENAWVKVTSKDDVSIDSLTVQSDEQKSKLNFGYFMVPFDFSEKTKWLLGRAKLSEEVVNNCSLDILKGRHDFSFAVTFQTGNPVYFKITLFGFSNNMLNAEYDNLKPEDFIGGVIDGICIAEIETDSYYIWEYELR